MGWLKNRDFWVTFENPQGHLGRCWVIMCHLMTWLCVLPALRGHAVEYSGALFHLQRGHNRTLAPSPPAPVRAVG